MAGSIDSVTLHSASPDGLGGIDGLGGLGGLGGIADKLAQSVRRLWQDEEDRRQIRDPLPLPVSWQTRMRI